MILADIANGNADIADVCFLVAFIVAVVGVIVELVSPTVSHVAHALVGGAVALIALGFMLL